MQQETDRGCKECLQVLPGLNQVRIKESAFTYNYVFPQHVTQKKFYDTAVKGLIRQLFQGYNVTILAYGQTGSGKTHTMGTNYSGSEGDDTKLGVIPQAVADIFNFIKTNEDLHHFKVNVSYMELYKEQCYDLLSGKEKSHSIIEIREDTNKGIILPGITEQTVTSTKETMMVLEQGSSRRVVASTSMNQTSSRSHAVFTITIWKESRTDKNLATTSKFHLVDLAGTERIKKTNASGERLIEGVKINEGLLALGNVISALGDGRNRSYISYRDSKLTRLLQDSLGGNSLTLMVACVSPADYNQDETASTLRYADRARRIRNKPIINQDPKTEEIVRLNKLVADLRLQLQGRDPTDSEQHNEKPIEEIDPESLRAKYADLENRHKQVTEQLNLMLIENTNLCEKALLAEAAKDKIEQKLNDLMEQCNRTIDNLNHSQDEEQNKTTVLDDMNQMKSRLEDLKSVHLKTNDELIDHEIRLSIPMDDGDGGEDVVLSEDQAVLEEEKRAMGQFALNTELQEINRSMAVKASMVQIILNKNKELESCNNIRETEEKISRLEKEKEKLLKNTKRKVPSRERGTKIQSLEAQITDLKNKCQQQASIIKNKAKNEESIASLNEELKTMKDAKVKIIRRMREESEKFRKWKADNERAMLGLRNEDRRRANEIAKIKSHQANLLMVIKRKMEEVAVAKKRLKDALDKQKRTQGKRKGNVKAGAIKDLIEQELEVHLSIVQAENSLDELMKYRALMTEQIENLRKDPDNEDNQLKIAELEGERALRESQITDLQQKIMTAEQEKKSRTPWDNIQSHEIIEAVKLLFDMVIKCKKELQNQSEKTYQARYEEMKNAYDRLVIEYGKYKADLETDKRQNELKVLTLVAIQRGVIAGKRERCISMRNVINSQKEKLDQVEADNRGHRSRRRLVTNFTVENAHNQNQEREPVKRGNGRITRCTCRGSCSNKICGCVRAGNRCSSGCRCPPALCRNRSNASDSEEKENTPPSDLFTTSTSYSNVKTKLRQRTKVKR